MVSDILRHVAPTDRNHAQEQIYIFAYNNEPYNRITKSLEQKL